MKPNSQSSPIWGVCNSLSFPFPIILPVTRPHPLKVFRRVWHPRFCPFFFGTSKFRMSGKSWFILISNPFPCLRKSNWRLRQKLSVFCLFFVLLLLLVVVTCHSKLNKRILFHNLRNEKVHNDNDTTQKLKKHKVFPNKEHVKVAYMFLWL